MAKEEEFVEKLSDFTRALESLVDILKDQAKNNPTEALGQFLGEIDADVIANIAENLKEVKTTTEKTEKNTEKIIQQLKENKKKEESGMFGETDDKKNKNKIVEGVKTIILIAGAVLAVGLAFKLVGKVDFLSVVALGLGIMFVAYAFAQVASVKDDEGNPITYKRAFEVSIIMSIMSLGIVGAGFILKAMPTIGIMQGISAIFVGVSIGLAAYALLNAVKYLTMKQIYMAAAIPILLPLIATGIVAAAFILKMMPKIDFMQILSALGVAIALVPITIAFGFLLKSIKDASMDDISMVGLAIPIIAFGVLMASLILQGVVPVPFFNVLLAGIAIGIATLFVVPTIFLLQKAGLLDPSKIDSLVMGAAAIVILSAAIMASSWLLSLGTYDKFPTWQWGLGAGLAIIMFTPALVVLGLLSMTGVGLAAIAIGALGVLIVAATIVAVSYILGVGSYDKYPAVDWALGVGLAFLIFIPTMLASVSIALLAPLIIPGMLLLAGTILLIDLILSNGSYQKYPSGEWAGGVGLSLLLFTTAALTLGTLIIGTFGLGGIAISAGLLATLMVASTIAKVSKIIGEGSYDKYPSAAWAGGVGRSMLLFATTAMLLQVLVMASLVGSLFGGGGPEHMFDSTLILAAVLVEASNILAGGNWSEGSYPSPKWSKGVGTSILMFAQAMEAILNTGKNWFGFGGTSPEEFNTFVIGVSTALQEANKIFNSGPGGFDDSKVPSPKWAKGVGSALMAFAKVITTLKESESWYEASGTAVDEFIPQMKSLSLGLIEVGRIWNANTVKFDDTNVPSDKWAKGVGGSLASFATAIAALDDAGVDIDTDDLYDSDGAIAIMKGLSLGLMEVGLLWNKNTVPFDVTKVPPKEWSKGISSTLISFANAIKAFDKADVDPEDIQKILDRVSKGIVNVAENLQEANDVGLPPVNQNNLIATIEKIFNIIPVGKEDPFQRLIISLDNLKKALQQDFSVGNLAENIANISEVIDDLDTDSVENLMKFGAGLNLLGVVNTEALDKTLSTLKAKQDAISSITDQGSNIDLWSPVESAVGKAWNWLTGGKKESTTGVGAGGAGTTGGKDEEMLAVLQNIDKNIEIIATGSSTPLEKGQDVDRD